jgi:hypothetical protein
MKNTKAKVTRDMLYTHELLTENNSYKLSYKLHFRINMTTPIGRAPMEKKSMNSPDEVRKFDKGKLELTTFKNGTTIGKNYT